MCVVVICVFTVCYLVYVAIRLDPNNIDLMEQKANLLLDVEEYKKALECFEIMLTVCVCVCVRVCVYVCVCVCISSWMHKQLIRGY